MTPHLKLRTEKLASGRSKCYVALVGSRTEISMETLVTLECTSLTEIEAELERLEKAIGNVRDEARRFFEKDG